MIKLRQLARNTLTKSAKLLQTAEKKLEPTAGSQLRELIDDDTLTTAEKFQALAQVQQMLKDIEKTKETSNA